MGTDRIFSQAGTRYLPQPLKAYCMYVVSRPSCWMSAVRYLVFLYSLIRLFLPHEKESPSCTKGCDVVHTPSR